MQSVLIGTDLYAIRLFVLDQDEMTIMEWLTPYRHTDTDDHNTNYLADLHQSYMANLERDDLQSFIVTRNDAPCCR
ncbi:hypothetical protein MKQ70_32540 [Chitinophaga sedimenti]|uniref:hypothetical protein n=1 Tax=Chitinophaga sedimenti TaxID=2033606 RepID=UPI0020030FB8|nr:hypothetical protein [Chitinophaga sedimenti]MCK7559445.1 hypothetical protein [Chitinophaga sedimenti]